MTDGTLKNLNIEKIVSPVLIIFYMSEIRICESEVQREWKELTLSKWMQ